MAHSPPLHQSSERLCIQYISFGTWAMCTMSLVNMWSDIAASRLFFSLRLRLRLVFGLIE